MPQLSLHTQSATSASRRKTGRSCPLDWGWGRDQTETPCCARAREQLHAYFDGTLTHFDLPLAPTGTPYRRRVWAALCDIPYGATRTYADIARQAGGSPRSVGQANGANPIPIIIPCHRVVATTASAAIRAATACRPSATLLALEARASAVLPSPLRPPDPAHATETTMTKAIRIHRPAAPR